MRLVAKKMVMIAVVSVVVLTLIPLTAPALPSGRSSAVLKVAGSIAPLTGIVQHIGGDYVNTSTLLPEGIDPHVSQLPLDVVNAASAADLLVITGHFPWESDLVNQTGKPFISLEDNNAIARYQDYGASLSPMPGVGGSNQTVPQEHWNDNPHGYWLVPRNAIAIANATRTALGVLNSTMSNVWDANFREFVAEVQALENLVSIRDAKYHFSSMQAIVVSAEEAYVAETFGIKCDAVLQVENVFISAGELLRVQEALRNGTIQLILGSDVSRLQTGGDFAYQLAQDYAGILIWWNTVSFSGVSDYVAMMAYNLGVLVSALEHGTAARSDTVTNLVLIMLSGLLAVVVVIETVVLIRHARHE